MLSAKLLKLIQDNRDEISSRLIRSVRSHPAMTHLSQRPELEIREWAGEILSNLSPLLSAPKTSDVARHFEVMGKVRFEEQVPLHEAVLRFQLLKDHIIGFIHEQGFPMT